MKITIDKDHIYCKDLKKVKEDVKEFKTRFTDVDLCTNCNDAIYDKYYELTGERFPYVTSGDLISANVEAFAWDITYGTYFRVKLLLDRCMEIDEITYYTNLDLVIDVDGHWNPFKNRYDYLFDLVRYKRERDIGYVVTSNGIERSV